MKAKSRETEELAARRRIFGKEMLFYAPGLKRYETEEFSPQDRLSFVPISLTGTSCALQCDHCAGKLLESMRAVEGPQELWEFTSRMADRGTKGVLITGGCDALGRVPLIRYAPTLKRMKQELSLKVLVHTGLVDDASAGVLAEIGVDGAMLDIIGAEETIRDVYHLQAGVEAYEQSLEHLARLAIPTAPHIVIGLHYGRILGEWEALEMVSRYPIAALVLVVITPLEGTAMSEVALPDLDPVGSLFREARRLLPQTPIILGCARPMGPFRVAIDRLAVDSGFNGIAYPAEGTVRYARKQGLAPRFYEECCALAYKELWTNGG